MSHRYTTDFSPSIVKFDRRKVRNLTFEKFVNLASVGICISFGIWLSTVAIRELDEGVAGVLIRLVYVVTCFVVATICALAYVKANSMLVKERSARDDLVKVFQFVKVLPKQIMRKRFVVDISYLADTGEYVLTITPLYELGDDFSSTPHVYRIRQTSVERSGGLPIDALLGYLHEIQDCKESQLPDLSIYATFVKKHDAPEVRIDSTPFELQGD